VWRNDRLVKMSSVSLTCAIKPAEGDPVRRVCSIPTGEGHLSCLSATLKDLQKEVNDSLTVLVEREREKGQGRKLAGEGEQDSKGE